MLAALCAPARADDRGDEAEIAAAEAARRAAETELPPVSGGVSLVRTDASWTYQLVTAPALAPQIGALAIAGLELAAGRGSGALPAVLGNDAPPPAPWPYDVDAPTKGSGLLRPKPPDGTRIAALFALTKFTLESQHSGLRVLEIRVRYRDGIVIWLNGVEVARAGLDGASTRALATRPHGPEWETFYVPAAPGLLRLGDNVLAFEVHPGPRRDAPELVADVVGRRDLGIVRGPVLGEVTPTTAVINVETDANLDATLEWGVGSVLDHTLASPAGQIHAFSLSELPPNTKLSYRVRAGAARTPVFTFHTMPGATDLVRIGVYGDVRGGHEVHHRIVESMLAEGLDVVTVTGDMVLRGSDDADWQRFFAVTRELLAQVRYLPAIGNHDVGFSSGEPSVFSLPAGPSGRPDRTFWYSLDLAGVHLVFLDSNAYDRTEQEQWLDADLRDARQRNARAIIAFTHDGPYSRGNHRGNQTARDRYVPILTRYHVDLLLTGHDHIYQRGDIGGLRYIVSGGGGAALYKASCGVAGKPKCDSDGMQKFASEHHFIVLTVKGDTLEMCPRKPDGKLLEPCTRNRLWRP